MNEDKNKIRIILFVLLVGIGLSAVKFTAYFSTHSAAIFTDALESVINIIAGCFTLFSVYFASLPKDENHPYGHGKIENFAAGFEGAMVLAAAGYIMYKSAYGYLFGVTELHSLGFGTILSAGAGLVNYIIGAFVVRRGKKYDSIAMIASGKHLISDTISSIGLVIGLLVIYITGLNWLDNVVAFLFGMLILRTGYKLVRESVINLLDEADHKQLGVVAEVLNAGRRDEWIDIHNLRGLKYGKHLHIDCHVTLPWYETLERSHEEVVAIEGLIKKNVSNEVELFIHADPCIPAVSCQICQLKSCTSRKKDVEAKIEWTLESLIPNKKHQL